ncbi:uncharacterized protein [Primulina huaijiensis]|uniref:uncharacterized protein isoform X1 n=1 Tax=Primulina huaijiensis TaxID=1492673 RepID=UPI003CC72D71
MNLSRQTKGRDVDFRVFKALAITADDLSVNISSQKASSKRSRKKKNLAELKEEENTLVKEKRDLKREIAALRVNLENQRSVNERLKRTKLELPPLQERELTSLPVLPALNIPFEEVPSSHVVCGAS